MEVLSLGEQACGAASPIRSLPFTPSSPTGHGHGHGHVHGAERGAPRRHPAGAVSKRPRRPRGPQAPAPGGAALLQGRLPEVVQAWVRTGSQKPLLQPHPGGESCPLQFRAAWADSPVRWVGIRAEGCQPRGGNWDSRRSQRDPRPEGPEGQGCWGQGAWRRSLCRPTARPHSWRPTHHCSSGVLEPTLCTCTRCDLALGSSGEELRDPVPSAS